MSTYRSRTQKMKDIQSGAFAEDHTVFHGLIPYGYRSQNPIEVLIALRSLFEQMGEYKQLWQISDLDSSLQSTVAPNGNMNYILFSGAFPALSHRKGNPHSYANPIYTHDVYPTIKDTDKRTQLIKDTYEIPFWHGNKLSQALGVTPRHAQRLQRQICGSYDGQRHNMKKWARTMKLIHEWGYQWNTIAKAVPYKPETLQQQVRRHASNFRVPSNPLDHNL